MDDDTLAAFVESVRQRPVSGNWGVKERRQMIDSGLLVQQSGSGAWNVSRGVEDIDGQLEQYGIYYGYAMDKYPFDRRVIDFYYNKGCTVLERTVRESGCMCDPWDDTGCGRCDVYETVNMLFIESREKRGVEADISNLKQQIIALEKELDQQILIQKRMEWIERLKTLKKDHTFFIGRGMNYDAPPRA
jgi:hypothetical protein